MGSLQADILEIERQIENLTREIDESMQLIDRQGHMPNVSRPRQEIRTSTPYARRTDRVLGDAGTADVCTCNETDRGSGNSRQHVACSTNTDVVTDGNQISQRRSTSKPRNFVKPATYDGSSMWNDYLSHFESVGLLNEWTETEKGLYLAASLRGLAQGVLGNQPRDERQNYAKLVKALQDRFAPLNQTELYRTQLRDRRQRAAESLPEMGQDIRRLVNLAYPTAPDDVREILATEQFLDGLHNSDMRLKIKQSRPSSFNDAIQRAVELEAFYKAEIRRTENVRSMDQDSGQGSKIDKFIETMEKNMQSLQREMKDVKRWKFQMQKEGHDTRQMKEEPRETTTNNDRRCYICGSDKHLRRHCPMQRDTTFQSDPRRERTKVNGPNLEDLSQDKSRQTDEHSRIVHSIKESGAYVTAKIFGMDAYLLIDTGATVSLLSKVCYRNMFGTKHSSFEKVESNVLSANGSPVDVYGKTSIDLVLNGTTMSHEMIIADLSVDGIFGLDFLVKHEAVIDTGRQQISICGREHPIKLEGCATSYGLAIVHGVSVSPREQPMVKDHACTSPGRGLLTEIRTTGHTYEKDKVKVKLLPLKYVPVSTTDGKRGRTDKDKMETNTHVSMKTASRRLPFHMQKVKGKESVWIERERKKRSNASVRRRVKGAELRQKHYHDMKMSYEQFKVGDRVYVYFPQGKTGYSPKLTSYWRGPFQVMSKLSEVLYKINCGRKGKEQVVHCDRIKICKAQELRGEGAEPELEYTEQGSIGSTISGTDLEDQDEDFASSGKNIEVTAELVGDNRPRRERRTPCWLQDYVQD